MEDVFVRAQRGQATLTPAVVDVLLQGVDVLRAISEAAGAGFASWHSGRQAEITGLIGSMFDAAPPPPAVAAAPPVTETPAVSAPQPQVLEVREEPAPVETKAQEPAATPLYQAEEGVVRVTARSLTRLMALAGESLVQARWLQPFSQSLLQLKRQHARLAETVEALRGAIPPGESSQPLAELLAQADQTLAASTRLVSERIDEFDERIRNTDDLTSRLYREEISSRMRPFRDGIQGMARLVRNALDHGLEPPDERLRAGKPEAGLLRIEATRLSDAELLEFLFLPGFTTSSAVTEISGRGVGLDVVRNMVHAVGGHVLIHTRAGRGTSFHLELPVTLSVLRAVIVEVAGEPYALPHHRIDHVLRVERDELESLENQQYLRTDGRNVGIVLARQVFGVEGPEPAGDDLLVVLISDGSEDYGLVVDRLLGEHDLVVRPLDRRLGKVPDIHAAAILDDGRPVLIVDVEDLRRSVGKLLQRGRLDRVGRQTAGAQEKPAKRVLVADDSITVREVERQLLANRGYTVETAVDGMEAWNLVREGRFDLVVSDVDMPRLDGVELVKRMKADPRLEAVPVIIVSYKGREEDRLRGLDAGANYYLTKGSFHDDTLLRAVEDLIGEAQG